MVPTIATLAAGAAVVLIHLVALSQSPQLQLAQAPPPAQVQPNSTTYALGGNAVCINGCPASVGAAVDGRDSSLWVLTLGGPSAGTGWCASRKACAWEANITFNATDRCGPVGGGDPSPLNAGGLTMADCEQNPAWCNASHGSLSTCDSGLYLGDGTVDIDGVTAHFRGQSILAESIQKLAALGLSKARHVLLHGFEWSGTAAVLHADTIEKLVRRAAPGVEVFKVLPVDAIHPNYLSMSCTSDIMANNCGPSNNITKDCIVVKRGGGRKRKTTIVVCPVIISAGSWLPTWLPAALANLWNLTEQVGAQANLPLGCVGPKCLWFNESAPHVKADLFMVQQMPGNYDHPSALYDQPGTRGLPPHRSACNTAGASISRLASAAPRRHVGSALQLRGIGGRDRAGP